MSATNTKIIPSPTSNVLELCRDRARYTPDFQKFRNVTDIPVFVYGTLKRGGPNNYLLKGSKFLGEADTCFPKYTMYGAGGFPVVFSHVKSTDRTKQAIMGYIKGEVFLVDLDTLCKLDRLEGNGFMYSREEQRFWLRDQEVHTDEDDPTGIKHRPNLKCWIYIGEKAYWGDRDMPVIASSLDERTKKSMIKWTDYLEK